MKKPTPSLAVTVVSFELTDLSRRFMVRELRLHLRTRNFPGRASGFITAPLTGVFFAPGVRAPGSPASFLFLEDALAKLHVDILGTRLSLEENPKLLDLIAAEVRRVLVTAMKGRRFRVNL